MEPRLPAAHPPYPPKIERGFRKFMPDGVPPIPLFRVLAQNERLFQRFTSAGILDRGPLSLRTREIAILRTSARCRAEYEWGVHVAGYAQAASLSEAEVTATVAHDWNHPGWNQQDAAVLRLCDELHDTQTLSDEAWQTLRLHFDEAQSLELIYIAGFYTAVAFLVNALRLPCESFTARFPGSGGRDDRGSDVGHE